MVVKATATRGLDVMILAPEDCGCGLEEYETASIVNSNVCSGTFMFMVLIESYLKGRCAIATPCSRLKSVEKVQETYDFIVVGAGAAGSVVAGRLSENSNFKVLLLEAGPDEPIGARVPSFYPVFAGNPKVDFCYRTVPNPNFCRDQNNKGCIWPRGKVLGGTNVLNGMMYHRGHPADYTDWVEAGAKGWSWEDNLPYILRTEGNKEVGTLVSPKYHGEAGPLPVQRFQYQPELLFDFMNAINSTGFPIISDINDPNTPEGFGIAQAMNSDGQRYTTARAFLKPTSERPNFHLKLNTYVTRVIIKDINGFRRAIGVEFVDESGTPQTAMAAKEVILCAGALNSPHILMLSGVGPKDTLQQFNIPVIADLPVGKTINNHCGMVIYFNLKKMKDHHALNWKVFMEYLLNRNGPMTCTSTTQLTGFLYSRLANKERQQPDLQYFFNCLYADCSRTGAVDEPQDNILEKGVSVSVNIINLMQRSVGYLTLNSSDPFDPPLFYPEFFEHPDDMKVLQDGVKHLQRIVNSTFLKDNYGMELDEETSSVCQGPQWSDEWVDCMARTYTDPQNHQMSTAAIGSVLDTQLQVYEVNGLRVIDASSIPSYVTGNIQGAVMMVAERGAQFLKDKWA